MNDIVTPVRSLDHDTRITVTEATLTDRRISRVDRLSLRIGLWLLLRSTRSIHLIRDHADQARVLAEYRARESRERGAAREQLLWAWRV